MAKKKVVPPKVEYEKISSQSCVYETITIPKDATHVEAELDYSSCYYESDQPYCMIHFYKVKN